MSTTLPDGVRPAVSVCVPTYNGEAYLTECLDSVLAQTMADFEVLVVDDGSADGTVALAERYAARDARVRVHRNPRNLGLVGNWQHCLELARGEWIKFVFQDDLIAPACLERMVAAGRAGHPLVACARDFVFEAGTRADTADFLRWHRALLDRLLTASVDAEAFCALVADHPETNLLGEPTAVLLHRSLFERFGPFHPLMVQLVDGEYWARVGTEVGAAYLHEPLATFRVHAKSATSRNHATRSARTALDPLVARHDYAFSPAYARLREVCRARRPQHDLEREFWRWAYQRLVVDGAAATLARATGRDRAEADAVFAAYPRLRLPRRVILRERAAELLARSPRAALAYRAAKGVVRRLSPRRAAA